ncbi:hypothetical protein COSO111634_27480 [Corallococcus soli]
MVARESSSASTCPVSRATVDASKSVRSGSSTPKVERTRETSCVASSEWPPSAKKSSCSPTRFRFSSSPKSAAMRCWKSVKLSGTEDVDAVATDRASGAGSA